MNTTRLMIIALSASFMSGTVYSDPPGNSNDKRRDDSKTFPREPFQFTVRVDSVQGSRTASAEFQVPDYKRLVIENVSANIELPLAQEITATQVLTTASGERNHHFVFVPKQGVFDPDVDNGSPGIHVDIPDNSLNIYTGGQQVRLYADPGTSVATGVTRNDATCPFHAERRA